MLPYSTKQNPHYTQLTARDIRKIAREDGDRPSLLPYFLLVGFFLSLDLAYYFFWYDLSRPIWEPIADLLQFLLNLVR